MGNSVQELLEMLYTLVSEAWGLPLGADKCVIERDKVLDLLDEIKAQLPAELAEAKRLVEDRARQMMDEQEIVKAAKAKSTEMVSMAEERSAELRRVANEYADDALRRTEEAIAEALNEVRQSRSKFRSVAANSQRQEPAED